MSKKKDERAPHHPGHPLLEALVDDGPPLSEGAHLLVGLVVAGHLLRGGGGVLEHLQLGLGVVLQVLAVAQDLAGLDQGDRFLETFLLASFSVLQPRLKDLDQKVP